MAERSGDARRRLVGPLPIAALIALATLGFWALHQKSKLLLRPDGGSTVDALALAYLRAALEHDPSNRELRLRLARAELALGLLDEADRTLAPLLAPDPVPEGPARAAPERGERLPERRVDPPPQAQESRARPATLRLLLGLIQVARADELPAAAARRDAAAGEEILTLALDVALARWRAARPGSPERGAAEQEALARLESALAHCTSATALARLAGAARELGHVDLAASAHERLATLDAGRCATWMEEAARDALALGAPARAGRRYARALACERGDRETKRLGERAIDAFLEGNRGSDALQLADELARRFPTDAEIVRRAEAVALSQGDGERARRFGSRLLALGARDAARLERQVDLALAADDRAGALAAAQAAADGSHDAAAHVRVAELASWAGRPDVALREWRSLARSGGPPGADERALALARALDDGATIAELLERRSARAPLSPEALRELEDAVERAEGPARAVDALTREVKRHPEASIAWERLAAAQERELDLAGALETRTEIGRRFGSTPAVAARIARLQWALGRPAEALRTLEGQRSVPASDTGYWRLLGELAWEEEVDDVALVAYRVLRQDGDASGLETERLAVLARGAGLHREAMEVARGTWEKTREPRLLVLAMDEAASAQRWADLRRLAERSCRGDACPRLPGYWLLRGRLEEHDGHTGEAAACYRRALAADPRSSAARASLIWLFGGARDRKRLAECLEAWSADAWDDPELRPAFGAGLEELGRTREALAFYERDARAAPADEARALRYAGALERVGDEGGAREVRRRLERRETAAARGPASDPSAADDLTNRDNAPPALSGLARAQLLSRRTAGVQVRAHAGLETTGPLSTRRASISARSEASIAAIELRGTGTSSSWGDAGAKVDPVREGELLLGAEFPALGGENDIAGGASFRPGTTLARVAVAHSRALAPSARARVEGAWNEPADESAAMRLEAVRTRADLALELSGRALYAQTGAALRRWSTRGGGAIGVGGLATAEVGYRILSRPDVRLRLQGSFQRNWLAPRVAALPVTALAGGPEDLLPGRFAMVVAGAHAARLVAGPFRLTADLWLGGMGPPIRPAYRAQLSVAETPLRESEISLAAFTGDDGWTGASAYGVGLSVTRRFSH